MYQNGNLMYFFVNQIDNLRPYIRKITLKLKIWVGTHTHKIYGIKIKNEYLLVLDIIRITLSNTIGYK